MPTSDRVEPVGLVLGDYDFPEYHCFAPSDVMLPQNCLPIIHRDGLPRRTFRGACGIRVPSNMVTDQILTYAECHTRDPTNKSCQYRAAAEIARSQGSTRI